MLSVTQSPVLQSWDVLTPEDFSPGALKDIFPFYLNHLFFRWSFLAFIRVWNMMSFGWKESLLQLKRKKSVSCITLPCRLEDMSEGIGNKWLMKKKNLSVFPHSPLLMISVKSSFREQPPAAGWVSLTWQSVCIAPHLQAETEKSLSFHSLNNLC